MEADLSTSIESRRALRQRAIHSAPIGIQVTHVNDRLECASRSQRANAGAGAKGPQSQEPDQFGFCECGLVGLPPQPQCAACPPAPR